MSSMSPRPTTSTSPQAKAILAAGRHVVCEKPLAMTADESAELVALAARSGLVNATNFNIRYYPLNQHAHELVAGGGARRCPAGHRPLLPGLAAARDRLELAARSRTRRGPAGGRRHRLPLARPDRFITGQRIVAVMAELCHVHRGPPASRPGRSRRSRPRSPPRPSPRHRDRGHRLDPAALRRRRPRRREHLPDQCRAQELAPVRDLRLRPPRSPGTRSSPIRCGSAIANGRTRS